MSFEAESTMIVNHKHAFRFMSLYMSTQMKHVLRYKCEVETLRNVEVITGTTLNGRTPSILRIFWVNVLCHFRVIKTMSHNQIRLQEFGERLIRLISRFMGDPIISSRQGKRVEVTS